MILTSEALEKYQKLSKLEFQNGPKSKNKCVPRGVKKNAVRKPSKSNGGGICAQRTGYTYVERERERKRESERERERERRDLEDT